MTRTPNQRDFYATKEALEIYLMLADPSRKLASRAISLSLVKEFHSDPKERDKARVELERIKSKLGVLK